MRRRGHGRITRREVSSLTSGVWDGFTAEPFRCEDCEDDEQRQHGDLRRHKRRLGLLGGYRVQRGHLQERLDDPDENVEVERA